MSANLEKAFTLYKQGEIKKAAKLLRKDKPSDFQSLKLLMVLESDDGHHSKAILIGRELLKKSTDTVNLREICNVIALCYSKLNNWGMREKFLEESVKFDSSEANEKSLFDLLLHYFNFKKYTKVERLALQLLKYKNCVPAVTVMLSEVASFQGDKALLSTRLSQASKSLDIFNKDQLHILITLMLGAKLFDLAEGAMNLYKINFGNTSIRQNITFLLGLGDKEGAKEYIENLGNKHLESSEFYYESARVHRVFKDFTRDYARLSEGTKLLKAKTTILPSNIKQYNASIPKLSKSFSKKVEKDGENRIFIFGFPRSGTTLLDNILDTQRDTLVLSERNILLGLEDKMETFNKRFPQDIFKLTNDEISQLSRDYLMLIEEQGFTIPSSGRIIEKAPHLTEHLPFVLKVFPQAKMIATLRHPLDVCLSCFQQSFTLNKYNMQLITMDDIVQRYIDVFTLLERYQEELSIQPHFIRYEDLVTDIEGEMTKIFDYIGMEADDSYLEFHKHASKKYVTSASRGQTDQAIYTSSMYKWKNYEEELAPYKEKLRYFIEKFGYEA